MGVRVPLLAPDIFPNSSEVEQVTVNHLAGGSNPSWGASGSVAERFKAAVLKTAEQQCSVSSNLTASARERRAVFLAVAGQTSQCDLTYGD